MLFVFLLILLFYISSPVAVTDAESSSDTAPDGINLCKTVFFSRKTLLMSLTTSVKLTSLNQLCVLKPGLWT